MGREGADDAPPAVENPFEIGALFRLHDVGPHHRPHGTVMQRLHGVHVCGAEFAPGQRFGILGMGIRLTHQDSTSA
ncbi:MAG: hypothetical protein B7Z30_02880 [Rhizobiales bacterium 12-68-15]|nr:MAG: hypothetical protein B7Z30_02880 [Rhizobiales bacterium 12-68-15]